MRKIINIQNLVDCTQAETKETRKNMQAYYDQVENALPSEAYIQPKHDGTCVYGIVINGKRHISTDNTYAHKINNILKDSTWENDVTLGFELICDENTKIQTKRVKNGLYLFYGARKNGIELNYKELELLSKKLGIQIVKQQFLQKKKIMCILEKMDDVDFICDIQEGMVLLDYSENTTNPKRCTIKSWQYSRYAQHVLQNKCPRDYLHHIIKHVDTLESLHNLVEQYSGPLDVSLKLHTLFLKYIEKVKHTITDNHSENDILISLRDYIL